MRPHAVGHALVQPERICPSVGTARRAGGTRSRIGCHPALIAGVVGAVSQGRGCACIGGTLNRPIPIPIAPAILHRNTTTLRKSGENGGDPPSATSFAPNSDG